MMQDHVTCENEEKQGGGGGGVEEELIENKVNFFDTLQGLEVARKYIQQSDVQDDIQ